MDRAQSASKVVPWAIPVYLLRSICAYKRFHPNKFHIMMVGAVGSVSADNVAKSGIWDKNPSGTI
jgi:hypothetical protein